MFIIETEDADGMSYWWDGDGWKIDGGLAKQYRTEDEAEEVISHFQSVSFGAKTDNATVRHA